MNTLSSNLIQNILNTNKEFKSAANILAYEKVSFPADLHGIKGSFHTFFIEEYCRQNQKKYIENLKYITSGYSSKTVEQSKLHSLNQDILIIVSGERECNSLKTDIDSLFPEAKVFILKNWGSVYYRPVPAGSSVFGHRAGVLAKLTERKKEISKIFEFSPRIFIITQRSAQMPLPPPSYIHSFTFSLSKGESIDTVKISQHLASIGYIRVPKVSVMGEFSLRGEVLDIFLPVDELAVRVIFDFDKIENIKTFDPENQTTVSSIDSVLIYPMKEVIWNEELLNILENKLNAENQQSLHLEFTQEAKAFSKKLLEELREIGQSEGEELFYSMLWDKKYSILDYIEENTPVFLLDYDRLSNAQESIEREIMGMYRKSRLTFPVLPPSDTCFSFSGIEEKIKKCIRFRSFDLSNNENAKECFFIECEAAQSYFGNINYLKEEIGNFLKDDWNIFIYADNENQAIRINELLKDFTTENGSEKNLFVLGCSISEGFVIPEIKLKVIQENEIFGRKKYIPKSLQKSKSKAIDTFVDLNKGDFVVHVNYGIGIFCGIERVKAAGNERDYIKLEYADKEFVFVSIEQVNMIQRYIGSGDSAPSIDRIGSKSWENRKNKVRKTVEELAQKLIDLYSRRKASSGFPFPKDGEWQTMFEAAFPYEDTPDQITVTKEIKEDMEKAVPMDRLLCGDVGYGKTEIAMRAAFKAVMGGKQVAFLAPTTILAEQHYETCLERFQNFPVKIEQLSRLVTTSQQKKILSTLEEGKIDILVGTHRIIQKDVKFKNLGLMIIDEEQRFGVKDKERLKVMKNNLDSLAMSATPIPRTLHMSLLKIRDMSLLTTPPQNRQPIETVIDAYSDDRVVNAIRQEIERGGQVFFLHNRIDSLNEKRACLERLLPEMLIDTAHGRMSGEELDDIFRRFKMGGFHVLVSTTIIENGIDIPNVNTIIIDRADMYGISQLYQLRGRVGRSGRKAYAFLLYPENKSLTETAMKRLQVISDFTELGSGFKIAMKDMEIRGAGNLLGRDQSGSVYSVGFDMYMRLLCDAVNRLTEKDDFEVQHEVLLELEYAGFIPETYIKNQQTKMEIYKKIAAVQKQQEMDALYNELLDRFGPVPDEIYSLLSLAQIRILCRRLNVSSIKERGGVAEIEFSKVSDICVDKVLRLIRESAGAVRLNPQKPNGILLNTGKIGLKEKSEFIRERLEKIV